MAAFMPWVVLLVGVFIAFVFLWGAVSRLRNQRVWPVVGGTVVAHERIDTDSSTRWAPVVEFVTSDGRAVRASDDVGTSPPRFRVGTPVPVRYDPADPRNVIVGNGYSMVVLQVLGGLVGGAVAAGAVAYLLR
jgi:hypothetical protein